MVGRISTSDATQRDALESLLRDRPSDEKNGVSSTLGFSYQQWWATLSIAELLKDGTDFAVGVEFKEDVAILDSSTSPTKVEFCQVKKYEREGVWTLKDLHKNGPKLKGGGHEPSILAKLYKRKIEFKGHLTTLRFVSNVGFKLPNEAGKSSHAASAGLSNLTEQQQDVVKADIAAQLATSADELDFREISLYRTNLPLGEPEAFIGGKLGELAATGRLPFPLAHVTVAARVLASEVQTRASDTSYARSFEELKARIVTRAQALEILSGVSASKAPALQLLDEALETLDRESHPYLERKAIRAQRVLVCAHASDRTNKLFHSVAWALFSAKAPIEAAIGDRATLGQLMNEIVAQARDISPTEMAGLEPAYIRAVALLVITDAININVLTSSAHPKSEEEE